MLLSARRSILLHAGHSGSVEDNGKTVAKQALLAAAAQRLRVPQFENAKIVSTELDDSRDQAVITNLAPPDIAETLRGKFHLFLVLDCLPPAERPGVEELADQGITAVTAEMVVFEWLERADSDDFRSMLQLIR